MKTQKFPLYALIPWILLLGIRIISLIRTCGSLVTQILGAFKNPEVYVLIAVFNVASILLLLCNVAAIVGVIVALFRKKCGKLLIASLALPIVTALLSLGLNFIRIFLQNNILSAATSALEWIATPLNVLAYLLLILFTIGAFFPKNKFFRFCATNLFFIPCLLSFVACTLSTITGVSNLISLIAMYTDAGIALSFSLLFSPICNLLLTGAGNLLLPISLLTLGLFIRKAVKYRFEELNCPITSAEGQ